jgi:hypothetical protein
MAIENRCGARVDVRSGDFRFFMIMFSSGVSKLVKRLSAALVVVVAGVWASAAPPDWWSNGNPPVIDPNAAVENRGVANIGQAKNMAKEALTALRAVQPDTANAIEQELVGSGKPLASWDAPSTEEQRLQQYQPLLIGQLKAISAPFYAKLHEVAPEWLEQQLAENQTKDASNSQNYFPWTSDASDDANKSPATIGQLKAVFSLRFENLIVLDSDGDALPDEWEIRYGLDPLNSTDAAGHLDDDDLSNLQEYEFGSNPTLGDTDNDGASDSDEMQGGTSPVDENSRPIPKLRLNFVGKVYSENTIDSGYLDPDTWEFVPGNIGEIIKEWFSINGGSSEADYQSYWGDKEFTDFAAVVSGRDGISFPPFEPIHESHMDMASASNGYAYGPSAIWIDVSDEDEHRQFGKAEATKIRLERTTAESFSQSFSFLKLTVDRQVGLYDGVISAEPLMLTIPAGQKYSSEAELAPSAQNTEMALIAGEIAVDVNRDEKVEFGSDFTSPDKPFRFWINNDQDDVEADEPVEVTTPDSSDSIIATNRDLEDFCRISVNTNISNYYLARGEIKIGLRFASTSWGSPSIRCWPNQSQWGDESYLKNGASATAQRQKEVFPTIGDTIMIPPAYWANTVGSTANMIFEGVSGGEGKLAVVIFDQHGTKLGEVGELHLKLLDVRAMYQRARVHNEAEEIPHPWVNDAPSAQTWENDPWYWPYAEDPAAEPTTCVFVHGWRMQYSDFLSWSDSSYKRLWHQGFKGKFYSFRWATYSADNTPFRNNDFDNYQEKHSPVPPGGFTYNPSEYRAWLCGPALASYVNQLPNPGRRQLFAHSMGNVIAGSALKAGMKINRYALCNAAMAAMAYDPNPALRDANLTFAFTPDSDADPLFRLKYGLENKFFGQLSIRPTMFNFGLPNDDALAQWSLNNFTMKPEMSALGTYPFMHEYYYNKDNPPAQKLSFALHESRLVTSVPEALAYITSSKTRAAGANLATAGAISGFQDMNQWGVNADHGGFDSTHSAQWRWNNQSTNLFWKKLTQELELK